MIYHSCTLSAFRAIDSTSPPVQWKALLRLPEICSVGKNMVTAIQKRHWLETLCALNDRIIIGGAGITNAPVKRQGPCPDEQPMIKFTMSLIDPETG